MEEASRILSDPINTSLASGGVVFLFALAILPKVKPKFIMTLNEKNKPEINSFRLVIFSVLLGASMSIFVFLWLYQGQIVEKMKGGEKQDGGVKMSFPRFGISF